MQDRIAHARKLTGLNQAEFAARIGFSSRALQKWEAGENEPRGKALRAISRVTGKPIEWFYAEEAA